MNKVFRALKQALEACLDIRILALLFTPFLLTVILGAILFFVFGPLWLSASTGWIEHSWFMSLISEKWQILSQSTVASVSSILALLLALLVILPVSYLLSVLVVSLVLLPYILHLLAEKDFQHLDKKRGGNTAYSVWNTLKVGAIYLVGLVVTLPLWLLPGFAIAIPVLLSAYLNKNIFVYDVLQDFATKEEREQIEKENWGLFYALGIILGFLNYLPLAFVVIPTFACLAYSYFCLNELKKLRENKP